MVTLFFTFLVAVAAATSLNSDIVEELSKFDAINDEYIEKLNSIAGSWTAGHNFPPGTKFADLEILAGTILKKPPVIKHIEIPNDFYIPKSFDARQQWPKCKSIKEIKNQGHCGSCWAVSSAAAMSDRLCISSKGKFNSDISAQHITSCSEGGCYGGYPFNALSYFVHKGAPTGGDYHSNQGCQPYLIEPCINRTASNGQPKKCPPRPYVHNPSCKETCYNHYYHTAYKRDLHFAKSVYGLNENVKQIQAEILRHGPVVADFLVFDDFLSYKSGVYVQRSSKQVGGHAIRIIGWGVENGMDYWLVSNQWGVEWGDHGLVKFRRGTNECNIEQDVVAGITGSI